ncbi:hypothetical protein LINPERHAP1_LOCUS25055 [Linum perenne]
MLKCGWEVKIQHIYREGNFLADHLANIGHMFRFGLHLIDSSTLAVASIRSSQPRLVLRILLFTKKKKNFYLNREVYHLPI